MPVSSGSGAGGAGSGSPPITTVVLSCKSALARKALADVNDGSAETLEKEVEELASESIVHC